MLTGFQALPVTRQVLLLVVLSGTVAAIVAGFLWSQQPEMQVLFSNLAQDDAGAIVAKLKEQKIPYLLEGNGGMVLVPTDRVHELRLQLAGQGLPQGGGVGFEIFDRTTVGMTDFVQKLNYRRALQGELARTVSQLSEVERARVHLVVPERSLFADQRERPRASVILSLRRGKTLSAGQVQGISHLVASSVEGLQPHDVTVVDAHGQILSGPVGDGVAQQTGGQLDSKRALEKDIEGRVQSMLERVVGAGKAVVRVSSLLDMRQVERTEEAYDPNAQVVRSENRQQEKSSSTNSGDGGVAGTAANLPKEADAGAVGSSANTSARTTATVNYEINKTVSRIVEPVGTIKKLSVAVLVDGTYEVTAEKDGKTQRKYLPRNEQEMKKLEELVKKSVGYSEERGDQVEVLNVAFDTGAVETGEPGAAPAESVLANPMVGQYVRYGVFGILAALVFLVVIRPMIRILTTPAPQPEQQLALPGGLPATVGQLEAALAPPKAQSAVLEMARSNPQSTAVVVKKWLKEK
jgi:flagellar M-ring protein FliF